MNHVTVAVILVSGLSFFLSHGCTPTEFPQPSATAVIVVTPTNYPQVTHSPEPTITVTPKPILVPGTITFELEGGGTYEMLQVGTAQDALTFIAQHARWHPGETSVERTYAYDDWLKITPQSSAFFDPLLRIPGLQPKLGLALPPTGAQFFTLVIDELRNGTVLVFESQESKFVPIYVAIAEKTFEESLGNYDEIMIMDCVQAGGTIEGCQKSPVDIYTPTARPWEPE